MLRDLFADPVLAADKRHSQVLRWYLGAPQTTDTVFRKIPRKPDSTWAGPGEALRRSRKP